MAVLPGSDREVIWAEFMDWWSDDEAGASLNKDELRDAINAADDWINTNSSGFNSALPVAARTRLTAKQKTKILLLIVSRRFGVM